MINFLKKVDDRPKKHVQIVYDFEKFIDTAKTYANFTESPIAIDFKGEKDQMVVNDGHKISVPIWSNEFLWSERDAYAWRLEREVFRILSKGDIRNWQKFRDAFSKNHHAKVLLLTWNMVEDTRVEDFAGRIYLGTGADITKINPRVPDESTEATNALATMYYVKHGRFDLVEKKLKPLAREMLDLFEKVKGTTAAGTVAVATEMLALIKDYYDDKKNRGEGASAEEEMNVDAFKLQSDIHKRGDTNAFEEQQVQTEMNVVVANMSVSDLRDLLKSGALEQMIQNSKQAGTDMCKNCTMVLMNIKASKAEQEELEQLQQQIQDMYDRQGEEIDVENASKFSAEQDHDRQEKIYKSLAAGGLMSKSRYPDPGFDRVLVRHIREMFKQIRAKTIYLPYESGNKLRIKKYIQYMCGNSNSTDFFERRRTIGGLDVRFVIDCSGSMDGSIASSDINPTGLALMKIQAAKYLMATFVEATAELPFLNVGVIAYTTGRAVNITRQHLRYLAATGGTPSHLGLMSAYKQLYRSRMRKKLIIHITDGHPDGYDQTSSIVKQIINDRIEIYTILITDYEMDADDYDRNVQEMYGGLGRIAIINDFAQVRHIVNTMVMNRIVNTMESLY